MDEIAESGEVSIVEVLDFRLFSVLALSSQARWRDVLSLCILVAVIHYRLLRVGFAFLSCHEPPPWLALSIGFRVKETPRSHHFEENTRFFRFSQN